MSALQGELGARLARGSIPAAEFMALALYHPREGYYRRPNGPWGLAGKDYYTALDAGPLLGEAMAARLEEVWRRLGCPNPFTVLEPGAGRGWLGRDLLAAARGPFAGVIRYLHRDDCPAGRQEAEAALGPWLAKGQAAFLPEADPIPPFAGAVLSLELFDALPTQPYRWRGEVWEMAVLTAEGPAWTPVEPCEATRWFEAQGAPAAGTGAPWCPGLQGVVRTLSAPLLAGLFLTIDYGHETPSLLARAPGLRRYRRHRTDDRWWEDPGDADLTSDVDFTRLAAQLAAAGLEPAPTQEFDAWIRTHAPLARWEADWPHLPTAERLRRSENLFQLTLPGRLGTHFRVLEAWRGP